MTIGTSIFLIVIGAILRYAVTWTVASVDLHTIGLILMIAGIAGLALSLLWVFLPRAPRSTRRPPRADPPYGTPYEPRDYDGRTYDVPETRVYDEPDGYDDQRDQRDRRRRGY